MRHQAKEHAKKVLDKVKVEKEVKLKSIQNNLKSQLEVRRDERIRRLNQQLSWSLNACGEAELKAEARVNETEEKIAKTQESIRAIRLKHRAALQAELTAKRNLQVK